ncbi:MAG: hypothetical protein PHH85_03580 [Candidatus Methanoperedens sp.]|nr:hypothetical protein [Candidatus Methanoperedens sp.]
MSEEPLTCGKCGTPLIINAAHVFFKGGKKAYIKCPNPACNNHRRIAFNAVEHLKPNGEEPVTAKPKTKDEIPKIIQDAITDEHDVKSSSVEGGKEDSEGGWSWLIGGIAGLFGLGALITWARR